MKAEVFNILIILLIQKIFLKMGHTSDQGGCSCRPGWDNYRFKILNFQTLKVLLKTTPKFKQKDLSIEKLCQRGVDEMASSVYSDQTAPLGTV